MFNFISKKIRSLIFDDKFICNLIKKTVKENLTTNWDIQFLNYPYICQFKNGNVTSETENDIWNTVGILTDYYTKDEKLEKGLNGCIYFNLAAIKNSISDLGYFDSIKAITSSVLCKVRYCQQWDFINEIDDEEVIERVCSEFCKLYDYPPEENIVEVDVKAFQLGINLDFNEIFARFIKNDQHQATFNFPTQR